VEAVGFKKILIEREDTGIGLDSVDPQSQSLELEAREEVLFSRDGGGRREGEE